LEEKKVVEVLKSSSRLIPLPDDEKDPFFAIFDDLVRVCQVVEAGVNSLYAYARRNLKPIGEVQLAYVYPDNKPQILFSCKRDEFLATSYSVFDSGRSVPGTNIYCHYDKSDEKEGEIKVRQSKEEPAKGENMGTRTIDKPKPKLISKSTPKPAVESKATVQNAENEGIVTLDDVVGATEAKKELMQVCDYFRNPEEYIKWGISQKTGVLLYGPPGTGKTLLARGLANEAKAKFISYKSQEIMSKWSGESETNLGKLLDEAGKSGKCVLLMDEFDALARKRELSDGSSHGTEGRLVNILLSFLDGFDRQDNVYLIGTTNRKEVIDDAILQRLYPIEVPLPDVASKAELVRRRIVKHAAIALINPFGKTDYQVVAEASEGLSGRDLVGEKQGIFLTLLHKAKERTGQNGGKLYIVSTQDWLDEIQKLKPETHGMMGFHS
jgi:SpoVK/Ycf46/Vps4 family AAA+-type ATPase